MVVLASCGASLWLLAGPVAGTAQAVLLGTVTEAAGPPVPGASVAVLVGRDVVQRTATNERGQYRLAGLPSGALTFRVEALGFADHEEPLRLEAGEVRRLDVVLRVAAVSVEGVTVQARRERVRFEEEAGATVVELAGADLRRLPGLAESDVLRAVEVLPGVVSTSDFSAAFNVRGGAADQNLILLDGIPIYNPFHLGGVFGVFNTEMVDRAELLSGGFPARYGGRVSSVLDVRSDAGDGRFGVDGAISLLSTRAAVSGGLPREAAEAVGFESVRGRFAVRRSYFDLLLSPFFDFPYHLTDVQAVAEGWTTNGVWAFTGYTGEDVLDLRSSDEFPLQLRLEWGNDVAGLRWSGVMAGMELETRLSRSVFSTGIGFPDFADTEIRSRIAETRAGADAVLEGSVLDLGFGGEAAILGYDNLAQTGGTVFGRGQDEGWSAAGYAQLSWRPGPWLLELGARLDGWDPASAAAWWVPSPRLAAKRFFLEGSLALKVAAGRYTQAVHSLRDEEVPIGIDLWITAGERAPLVISDQAQAGLELYVGTEWHASLEGYYRRFDGVIASNPAEDPNDPLDDLLEGTGESYGADLLIRRQPEPDQAWDGWIAVSLLRATRTFPDPLGDASAATTYPPIYDRRLDLDLVLRFPLPGGVDGGLRFNFGSGLPYTRPLGAYPYLSYRPSDGRLGAQTAEDEETGETTIGTAVVLGPRNGERYPPYHRLDLSFRKRYERSWGSFTPFLDVLNVYDRRDNVLFYFYEYDVSPPTRTGISMLPVIPTLGVEVSF